MPKVILFTENILFDSIIGINKKWLSSSAMMIILFDHQANNYLTAFFQTLFQQKIYLHLKKNKMQCNVIKIKTQFRFTIFYLMASNCSMMCE